MEKIYQLDIITAYQTPCHHKSSLAMPIPPSPQLCRGAVWVGFTLYVCQQPLVGTPLRCKNPHCWEFRRRVCSGCGRCFDATRHLRAHRATCPTLHRLQEEPAEGRAGGVEEPTGQEEVFHLEL